MFLRASVPKWGRVHFFLWRGPLCLSILGRHPFGVSAWPGNARVEGVDVGEDSDFRIIPIRSMTYRLDIAGFWSVKKSTSMSPFSTHLHRRMRHSNIQFKWLNSFKYESTRVFSHLVLVSKVLNKIHGCFSSGLLVRLGCICMPHLIVSEATRGAWSDLSSSLDGQRLITLHQAFVKQVTLEIRMRICSVS